MGIGLLVHPLAQVNVGSLKVNLCLRTDEQLALEVGRIKNLVQNDRKLKYYS